MRQGPRLPAANKEVRVKKIVRIISAALVLFFVTGLMPLSYGWAENNALSYGLDKKNDRAVGEDTTWQMVWDWVITLGGLHPQKEKILAKVKAKRAIVRTRNEMEQQQKLLEADKRGVI